MNNEYIDSISKNIIFKEIEEEAIFQFQRTYQKSPLELIFKDAQKLNVAFLSKHSLVRSISLYLCIDRILGLIKNIRNHTIQINDQNKLKEMLNFLLKYVEYLYEYKDEIDYKWFTLKEGDQNYKMWQIKDLYFDFFNFLMLLDPKDQIGKRFIEFLLYSISKIDDLNMPFDSKWNQLFNSYFSRWGNYQYYKLPGDSNGPKFLHSHQFLIGKILFDYFYKILNTSNNQWKLFQYILKHEKIIPYYIDRENIHQFYDQIHKAHFLDHSESNNDIIETATKCHKLYLKKFKKYLDDFTDDQIQKFQNYGDTVDIILFSNYRDEFFKYANKYFKTRRIN